jgi:hypothetical protein
MDVGIERHICHRLIMESAKYFHEERISSWFPHREEIMIPQTTHMLHMMHPERVAASLRNFFSKNHFQ